MRLGVIVESTGEVPARLDVRAMARCAEQAGADGLWVSDHLLMVDRPITGYPYQPDGQPSWPVDTDYYETFVLCATMAAVTERCRVGTAVLVLPQRNVLEVAKMAATLDRVSGGRLALGVGAGWYEAEMEALGYAFTTRGTRFDEMLGVLHDCWGGRPGAFDGEVTVAPDLVLHPRPAQAAGPPLLVGGMTGPALRRAARHGDGWMALAFADRLDVAALAERLATVRGLRGPERPFETVLKLHAKPPDTDRLPALLRDLLPLGFDEIAIEPPWSEGLDAVAATVAAARAVADETETPNPPTSRGDAR